jgi:GT2 family glycosyltransferase
MSNTGSQQKVSVQIVTYNSAEHIVNCLEAVISQSYPIAQIIVVDNASTDATQSLLEQYKQQALFLFNEHNVGFAPAHNQALNHTIGDYCLVLNPDVILDCDYITNLMNGMESDPQIGSTTGKLLLQSSPGLIDSTGLVINKARRAFDRDAGQEDLEAEKINAGLNEERVKIFGVSGAAAMYSRNMINHVSIDGQFFDEAFFAYKEDVDVAWRAQLYGWTSFYIPQALAYHERGWKGSSRKSQPLFIRQHSYINRYRMILKNDRFSYIFRHCLYLIPFELASLAFILFREPALMGSWLSLFRDLPNIKRQRAEIKRKTKLLNVGSVYRFFQ